MLTCKDCGYSLIGETQKGHRYYRCHTRTCPPTSLREEVIHQAFIDAFLPLSLSPDERKYLEAALPRFKNDWASQKEIELSARQLRLTQLDDRVGRLTDAYIDGALEKELFEARKTTLLMERKEVQEQIAVLNTPDRSVPDQLEKYLEGASSAYSCYERGDNHAASPLSVGKPLESVVVATSILARRSSVRVAPEPMNGGRRQYSIPRAWPHSLSRRNRSGLEPCRPRTLHTPLVSLTIADRVQETRPEGSRCRHLSRMSFLTDFTPATPPATWTALSISA
jgi:hypothetical protein